MGRRASTRRPIARRDVATSLSGPETSHRAVLSIVARRIFVHEARSGFDQSVHDVIRDLWRRGDLPARVGRRWVCGVVAHKSFWSADVSLVLVGPGRPTTLKSAYVVSHTDWRSHP